jgi:16S rRNA (cytosine1402-N4)-methyltransferase
VAAANERHVPDGHVPVMLTECLDLLAPALSAPGAVVVDATLGLGGHSEALLRALPDVRLVGLDRDPQALARAGERLAPFGERVELVHAVYDEIGDVLARLRVPRVRGVLFDLGVSSMQLDTASRGFSYVADAPLDMRMDQTTGITAAEVVAEYSAGDLIRLLRAYADEPFAGRIADAIVRERARTPITTTGHLAALVRDAIPAAGKRTGGNPAKRTFQALRIEVNREMSVLARALPAALDALDVGGRIVALAYHSIEDRLVKRALAAGARSSAPPGLPVTRPEDEPWLRLLTRGALRPADEEMAINPRAASARLRAAERIRREPVTDSPRVRRRDERDGRDGPGRDGRRAPRHR